MHGKSRGDCGDWLTEFGVSALEQEQNADLSDARLALIMEVSGENLPNFWVPALLEYLGYHAVLLRLCSCELDSFLDSLGRGVRIERLHQRIFI